jgi:steroid delta-isomerase-like uncharacterized protein
MADNESVVREFLGAIGDGCNVDAAAEHLADDVEFQMAGMPPTKGIDAWRQMAGGFQVAFPDLALTVREAVSGGDLVSARWVWTATHQGDLMGLPATGKRVEAEGCGFYRVRDGKIVSEWVLEDMLAVMQQVGAAG